MPNCLFQDSWLLHGDYKEWIQRDPTDKHSASCKLCKVKVDIGSMGTSALRSHAKGKKHLSKIHASAQSFSLPELVSEKRQPGAEVRPSLNHYVSKTECLEAEVWHVLNLVNTGQSFRSSRDIGLVWQKQFPGTVAEKATCGETKAMYLACFGLAPYFRRLLQQKMETGKSYVLLFDETLNYHIRKKQLDFMVRIWDGNKITTRYLDSEFLGHSTAADLLGAFENKVDMLALSKGLLQLSMDGPAVNWSFHSTLDTVLQRDHDVSLLNVGSCGLHLIHNGFQKGSKASDWELERYMQSLYNLWKDCPARRADYELVTKDVDGSDLWPKKFCKSRWLESIIPAQRAIDLIPAIRAFIDAVRRKKVKDPKTMSFEYLQSICFDPPLECRLACFISVAKPLEKFLTAYQTDGVMLPFLASDLETLIRKLLKRFVKPSILSDAEKTLQLLRIDPNDETNHVPLSKVDLGFVAQQKILGLLKEKKISEKQVLEFRIGCLRFLCTVTDSLLEKAPLKFRLVRNLSCLDPRLMISNSQLCATRFGRVLTVLVDAKRVKADDVDEIKEQFDDLLVSVAELEDFRNFSIEDHLDEIMYSAMAGEAKFRKLWDVVSKLLLLSHGQAAIERGFSLNKYISVDNLSENNLVNLRIVKDHIRSVGGLRNVDVSKALLTSAGSACQRYEADLKWKRDSQLSEEKKRKRKSLDEEIEQLRKKQMLLQDELKSMNNEAEKFYEKAEAVGNIRFVASANCLRRAAKDKSQELDKTKVELQNKLSELKTVS